MTVERDLDLAIGRWVRSSTDGPAPVEAVRAALAIVSDTPQRRRAGVPAPPAWWSTRARTVRLVLVIAAVAIALVTLVIGIGALVDRSPLPTPTAISSTPGPRVSAAPGEAGVRQFDFRDIGIQATLPASWSLVNYGTPDLVRLEGPDGTVASIYHGDPRRFAVCDPGCETVELPFRLPFDPGRVRADIRQRLSDRVAASGWRAVERLSPRLVSPSRLDAAGSAARPGQHAYVVATYLSEAIVIAISTPGDVDASRLMDEVLWTIVPYPVTLAQVGRPTLFSSPRDGFEVLVPDVWSADSDPVPGVHSFGDGRLTISIADATGTLAVCDPTCSEVAAGDLVSLEGALFRGDAGTTTSGDMTLSGYPGRFQMSGGSSGWYRAIAIVGGVVVHLWVSLGDDVEPSVAEAIAASFAYVPPPARGAGDVIAGAGFELRLDPAWERFSISVSAGTQSHQYWLCTITEFSSTDLICRIAQAQTLAEMAEATGYGNDRTSAVIDGEPALVVRIESYEYPARGGQWTALIMTVHHGQPFFIRIQNGETAALPVDGVLAAFRFVD